jgi:hypothetical protein
MKNQAQGLVNLYLLKDTTLNEETFNTKFHTENIVTAKLEFVLSDGSIHSVNVMELMDLNWISFQKNEDTNEEEATKQSA